MKEFTIAFFGHRYIDNPLKIEELLKNYIINLLSEKEYVVFLVGRNGEFDKYVASAIRQIKKECLRVERIKVLFPTS